MHTSTQHSGTITAADRQQTSFGKAIAADFLQMTCCFLLAIYAVYYAPAVFNHVYFLVLMVIFWRSRHDYFWFGFYFILINTPAFLFFETSAQAQHRLPMYSLLPGVSFSVFDVFVLTSLAKVVLLGKTKAFTVSRSLRFIVLYFALVSIPITFIIGLEDSSFFNNFRPYFYYVILISFYFLVDEVEDLYKFGYLMLPYVLFTFYDQLFLLTQGKLLIAIINPETVRQIVTNTVTGDTRAYFSGFLLVFYAFIFALQLRFNKKYELFSGMSFLVILVCMATFVLSATRAYLMMPLLMLVMYFVLYSKKGGADLVKLTLLTLLFGIVFFSLQLISLDFFLKSIWPRFEAFFSVIFGGGNLAEFDTVQSRVDEDLPHILKGVMHNPLIGTGFSGIFRQHENNDLGFINTILIFGGVGFLFFVNFFVVLFRKLNRWITNRLADTDARTILISIQLALFGVLLGYATTYDFFTVRQIERIYFVSIVLASAEVAIARIKHQILSHKNQSP